MRTAARFLLAFLALAQFLDVVSTNAVLASVPGAAEGNPVMLAAMGHLGSAWWLVKLPAIALCLSGALWLPLLTPRLRAVIVMVSAFYAVVVAFNFANLLA